MEKITPEIASQHLIKLLLNIELVHSSRVVLDATTRLDLFKTIMLMSVKKDAATLLEQGDGRNGRDA